MRYVLAGLDCAACAAEIELELQKIAGLENTAVNFASRTVELPPELVATAQATVNRIQPGLELIPAAAGAWRKQAAAEEQSERRQLYPVALATALFALGWWLSPRSEFLRWGLFIPAYLLVGWPVLGRALSNLVRGRVFDEHFLMSIASLGAIAIGELPEAVAVMLFYSVGEYFQNRAVNRSRRSIAALLAIRPDWAHVEQDSQIAKVPAEAVTVGQTIIVKPGERVPLDGLIIAGSSSVDTSALTGEPIPRHLKPKDTVLAGMVNGDTLLKVRVTKAYGQSAVARILELVEEAELRKAPAEQFITTFARYYTPAVVAAAIAIAVLPPLFLPGAAFTTWLYHSLVLLVISCPCALVLSIPLGYFGGIGNASRQGILIKGGNFLDALANLRTVVFDKTGTLTEGVFAVREIRAQPGFTEAEILRYAAYAEAFSTHPIAESIKQAYGQEIEPRAVSNYQDIPGHGVLTTVDGRSVLAGNDRLLHRENIPHDYDVCAAEGTRVFVAVDGQLAGEIIVADQLRKTTSVAVQNLRRLGVEKFFMLTGDGDSAARQVAQSLNLDGYFAGLLPEGKVQKIEDLMIQLESSPNHTLAFVGDGVNDAPVIARADIGVAMGGLGSDAAIEAADVVLMQDNPAQLVTAVSIARHTCRIVKQNIVIALAIKFFFLILGALGLAAIWEAVFADVGVALLAVLNAARTLRYRPS
ncbi:MAG: cadmium-translocating P-type ATPase [Firmicutes bacterium]|nr:cadmium-translocating P-type ATPase [Bacillota bacterium]